MALSDIVNVAHPAIVRHVPVGCREWRHSIVRVDTPVRLRSVSWSETDEGPVLPVDGKHWLRTRLLGGRLYRVVGDDGYHRGAGRGLHLRPSGFKEWLSGQGVHPTRRDQSETIRCFAGTPLVAMDGHTPHTTGYRPILPAERMGRVRTDLRDEARAALVRHFETDVVVSGGVVMARYKGPNAQFTMPPRDRDDTGKGCWIGLPRFPGMTTYGTVTHGLHYRIDRARAVRQERERGAVDPTWYGCDLEGCPMGGLDDVWLSLHSMLQSTFPVVTRRNDISWDDEATRERAMPYVERAVTHMLQETDLEPACGIVEGICSMGYTHVGTGQAYRIEDADAFLDYALGYAMPAIRERVDHALGDMDALVGLGGPG